jgi:hypothetical protein
MCLDSLRGLFYKIVKTNCNTIYNLKLFYDRLRTDFCGDPYRTRTCRPKFRKLVLYPDELTDHPFKLMKIASKGNHHFGLETAPIFLVQTKLCMEIAHQVEL